MGVLEESAEEKAFFEEAKAADQQPAEEESTDTEPAPSKPDAEASTEEAQGDEPEQPEAESDEEGKADGEERKVNYGALHEERERRKELQRQLEDSTERMTAMERRFAQFMERFQQPSQQQEQTRQAPDPQKDPLGYQRYMLEEMQGRMQQQEQQTAQQQQWQQFASQVSAGENMFRQEAPDYDDAVAFAKQARDTELKALGYDGATRQQIIQGEIMQVARDNLSRGVNPAKTFYEYAKVRGYQPASAQQPAEQPAQTNRVKDIADKQARTKSLGTGGDSPDNLSLEALSQMSDEDFDKNFAKLWGGT